MTFAARFQRGLDFQAASQEHAGRFVGGLDTEGQPRVGDIGHVAAERFTQQALGRIHELGDDDALNLDAPTLASFQPLVRDQLAHILRIAEFAQFGLQGG